MCDKVINTNSSTIQFAPVCYKTQEMCCKAFNKCFLAFFLYSRSMQNSRNVWQVISEDLFSINYVPDEYKTQQMCDEAVDDCWAALKFVPDWFFASKMIKVLLLFTQMKIYSILMKILVMSCLLIMAWVFLIWILIILSLRLLIMMRMILILLWWGWSWYYYFCHIIGLAY